ncbi:hypothetical protein WUBG_07769 [Wuchereria bancrofti]|uniref:OB domain-containing protein n=1 Tax=Wuchereria bancrofti TaxID=6293 RepID=J9B2Y6_WUCBA|nr:hypothetical protein WUBG_07769 [Wuchereria bancrofti]
MSVKAAIKLLQSHPVLSLLQINQKLKDIRIQGWARRVETRGKFLFLHVSDGCSLKTIQAVVQRDICPKVSVGSAVDIVGDWVMSNGKQQNMELTEGVIMVGLKKVTDQCGNMEFQLVLLSRITHLKLLQLLRIRGKFNIISLAGRKKENA